MDYGIVVQSVLGLLIAYSFRKQYDMEKKVNDHETRIKVEESKGRERDNVSADIKKLLHDIAGAIGTIKQEQEYWRGLQEGKSS